MKKVKRQSGCDPARIIYFMCLYALNAFIIYELSYIWRKDKNSLTFCSVILAHNFTIINNFV
jgi:hypothetical protein